MAGTVHVIGAGLSGLSAAVELAARGERVVVHEAAKFAGGRCRTYYDSVIDLDIDNGNHLLLSGNWAALAYLRRIGGLVRDDGGGEGRVPVRRSRRPASAGRCGRTPAGCPGGFSIRAAACPARARPTILRRSRVLRARATQTVGDVMPCSGPLYDRLWRPVLLAALNTEPAEADARLAAQILRETLAAGGHACRPMVATGGLSAAFIDPALA